MSDAFVLAAGPLVSVGIEPTPRGRSVARKPSKGETGVFIKPGVAGGDLLSLLLPPASVVLFGFCSPRR